ncbi:ribbon-helix-helix domain-containing protein [Tellurirhabdus bombi]|uniref:ribbon-helix-helix domain-containing protein n=1 Tax=Tellurirhabdus bombi TaxID=2907205 RepID=UPI001F3E534D|nr:Arc family DNA-binding protein [Tellurirhabdus bombi]
MAAEKKAFVLRINPETLKELERWAQEEFRSVNGQIEFILHEALKRKKQGKAEKSAPSESDSTEQVS